MILNKAVHLLMLCLFVLLQSMTPLVHAHFNGHSEDNHIHLAEVDSHHDLQHHAGVAQATAEEDHSRVVGLQPEYRSKQTEAILPVLPAMQPAPAVAAARPVLYYASATPRLAVFPYQRPHSQAPPA